MKSYVIGAVIGIVLSIIGGVLFMVLGIMNMTATGNLNILDWLGHQAFESAVWWRSPDQSNPFAGNAEEMRTGFDHYRKSCALCHGGPGLIREPFTYGMMPVPPSLTDPDAQENTDGELFYIIRNGVRMTGMPGFSVMYHDDDIWKISAALRDLKGLDEKLKASEQQKPQQPDKPTPEGDDSGVQEPGKKT